MDFFKLGRTGAKAQWLKIHQPIRDYIKNKHYKLSKEKARILGFLMGDGSVSALKYPISSHQHHDFCFYPDNYYLAKLFSKDFKKLYLKEPLIRKAKNYYRVRVSSKPAWEDLCQTAKFSSLNWDFPKLLSSKQEKIEWLRALADCEAYIDKKTIRIQSVSKKGILSINKLLNEFEIGSKVYKYNRKNKKWNINYILVISKRENVKRYQNLISFNHPSKKEKLDSMPACLNH